MIWMSEKARTLRLQDVDYRREPKTGRYCVNCQRDVGVGARFVTLLDFPDNGPPEVMHPHDLGLYARDRLSEHLIGNDCAKRLGLEWSYVS